MTITLSPDQERLVVEAMASAGYRNAGDVISRALEVLRVENVHLQERQAEVSEKIEWAFAQIERGEFLTPEESRADIARRKAIWQRLFKRQHLSLRSRQR